MARSYYGRWVLKVIYKGTEATALSSKSIQLRLGHSNAVDKNVKILAFCPLCSVKPRVLRIIYPLDSKKNTP
jgi:hypothetical protein